MTDIPGTTRDLLTEIVDIDGAAITLIDTAGLHGAARDAVEQEGISRAHAARRVADLASSSSIVPGRSTRTIANFSRRPRAGRVSSWEQVGCFPGVAAPNGGVDLLAVSAKSGRGIDELRRAIITALSGSDRLRDTPAVTNARHAELLSRARATRCERAAHAAEIHTAEEFVAADVSEARAMLEEVTGARTPDDVLHAIFSRFCIGK